LGGVRGALSWFDNRRGKEALGTGEGEECKGIMNVQGMQVPITRR